MGIAHQHEANVKRSGHEADQREASPPKHDRQ